MYYALLPIVLPLLWERITTKGQGIPIYSSHNKLISHYSWNVETAGRTLYVKPEQTIKKKE